MTIHHVDHGPDKSEPVKPDPTWGESIAVLLERYLVARDSGGAAEQADAKRKLEAALDENLC